MTDGVKFKINGEDQHRLRSHSLLTWQSTGVNADGYESFKAVWRGFYFKGDKNRCTQMRGSFHALFYNGQNYEDFTHSQFAQAVEEVCVTLRLHPARLTLSNVELGVNIRPPIETIKVLKCVILHGTKGTEPTTSGIQIVKDAYRLKIYDKAEQYNLHEDLLRLEVHVKKMRQLKACGIKTLANLLDENKWAGLAKYFTQKLTELLIVEPSLPELSLNRTQRRLNERADDLKYWTSLNANTRSRKRVQLKKIYGKKTEKTLHEQILNRVKVKLNELNDGFEKTDICTDGSMNVTQGPDPQIRTFASHVIKGANVPFWCKSIPVNMKARNCFTCGRDISGQALGSKYCSEKRFGKEGKRCRNVASNRIRSIQTIEQQDLLFDHTPFIRPLKPP